MILFIGNKNYSSWSLRGWLAAKLSGLPFEERLIPLNTVEFTERIGDISPSRLVPALHDRDLVIWDSLAIIEYLNEKAPRAGFWPLDPGARATARSVCAEMHAGFATMRQQLPMNIRKHFTNHSLEPQVRDDVHRVQEIWADCRARSAAKGKSRRAGHFLFGPFSAADILYAPVVFRFASYDVPLNDDAKDYLNAMLSHPFMIEWAEAAKAEEWVIEAEEITI